MHICERGIVNKEALYTLYRMPSLIYMRIYIYVYICIYVYIYVYIYIYVYLYMYVYKYICVHIYKSSKRFSSVQRYMREHIYIYKNVHIYICIYVHMYIYICVHTQIFITHTQTHLQGKSLTALAQKASSANSDDEWFRRRGFAFEVCSHLVVILFTHSHNTIE